MATSHGRTHSLTTATFHIPDAGRSNKSPMHLPLEITSNAGLIEPIPKFVEPMLSLNQGGSMISDIFMDSMVLGDVGGSLFEGSSVEFGDVEAIRIPDVNYTMHVLGADPAGNLTMQSTRRLASREKTPVIHTRKDKVTTLLEPISHQRNTTKTIPSKMARRRRAKPAGTVRPMVQLMLECDEKKNAKEMKRNKSLGGRCFSLTDRKVEFPDSPQSSIGSSVVIAEGSRRAMGDDFDFLDDEDMEVGGALDTEFEARSGGVSVIPSTAPEERQPLAKMDDDDQSLLTEDGNFPADPFGRSSSPMIPDDLSAGDNMNQPAPPYRKILTPLAHQFKMAEPRDIHGRKDRTSHTPSSRIDSQRFNSSVMYEEETSEYQVHSRLMGWKLTSPERRKYLLNLLEKASYEQNDDWVDVEAVRIKQTATQRRVDKRAADAYHDCIARSIVARAATPAGRMAMLANAKPDSTISRVLVDRMSILNDFKRTVTEERKVTADNLRSSRPGSSRVDALGASTDMGSLFASKNIPRIQISVSMAPSVGVNVLNAGLTGSVENLISSHKNNYPHADSINELGPGLTSSLSRDQAPNSSVLVNMRDLNDVEMPFDDSLALASVG